MGPLTMHRAKNVVRTVVQQHIAEVDADGTYSEEILASEKLMFDRVPMDNEKVIDMSHVCALAEELMRIEGERLGISEMYIVENDESRYTDEAQVIFDKYYDLITSTLNF